MSLGFVRQFPHDLSRLLDPLHAVHRFAGPERHRVELPRRGLVGDERGARLYGNADPRSPRLYGLADELSLEPLDRFHAGPQDAMGRIRPVRGEGLGEDRVLRLGRGTELPGDEGATRVGDLHEFRVRLLVEELDDRGPGGRHLQDLQEVGVELASLPHAVDDEVRAERAGRRPTQAVEDLCDVFRRRGPDPADHPESSRIRDRGRQGRRGDLAHPRLLQRHRAPEQFREFRLEHHDPLRTRMASSPLAMSIAPSQTRFPCRGRPRGEPRPPRSRSAPIVWLTRESTFANLWASYMYNYPYNIMP